MEIPVFTVDAFTNFPFKGNPAAVCLLLHELQDDMYQNIAAEMNLSETAFIIRLNSKDDFSSGARFRLRWFTPTTEVPLCGHATLASAAVLFYKKKNVNSTVLFETLSGELYVRQQGESIVMDFPLNKPTPVGLNEFKDIVKAAVGDQPVQEVCLCAITKMLMVCLADSCDRSVLTSLQPDPAVLLRVDTGGRVRGLLVTSIGDPGCQPGYDFYSRNFFPWFGVPEDPVTGSAHTVLAGYWSEKLGKKKMLAYQCSSRGGELELELQDDGRLDIAGQAVTVLQGILTV
ncbi:phenazine biosynthesis-like domain-containing protein 2 [Oncorhynchus kisutch]|uniref:Phenazine biosynthesis-like domain-containing protein 2 n=1 Tax=Oncorhynchus kisutch TaxID=8019 RepID=A0A8C7LLA6_ONCKI|nr:phenazine biosynthesis-like domain-containing protein 2 [Oncorhynchus kisutch]XP_031660672.1 phenazine biosynthesis-like domain-containing protein 2 [Oncorhynchus kisutch]XP_031660673.1 phenazine biosynthesis-like domain-containing protein 2 [Oncorhynchus kisutch]XP_031660674.1 phenazine biosynthesis-like domain-containing protein 2 [Oncorhynchus kisutch]